MNGGSVPAWSEAAKQLKPGKYRHFKGGEYELISLARHSETLEELVVYRSLQDTELIWVRPLAMWNEQVNRDGYQGPRFRPL